MRLDFRTNAKLLLLLIGPSDPIARSLILSSSHKSATCDPVVDHTATHPERVGDLLDGLLSTAPELARGNLVRVSDPAHDGGLECGSLRRTATLSVQRLRDLLVGEHAGELAHALDHLLGISHLIRGGGRPFHADVLARTSLPANVKHGDLGVGAGFDGDVLDQEPKDTLLVLRLRRRTRSVS